MTAQVKAGAEPATPFSVATPSVLSKAGPTQYREVRVWFELTAGAVGTAPQSLGPVNTTVTVGTQDVLKDAAALFATLIQKDNGIGLTRFDDDAVRGVPFTREALLTAAVWPGGDRPDPDPGEGDSSHGGSGEWCRLLRCILDKQAIPPQLQERWRKQGFDLEALRACLEGVCDH